MTNLNPTLAQALVADRAAELARHRATPGRCQKSAFIRRRAGWALVELGLRLAMREPVAASPRLRAAR